MFSSNRPPLSFLFRGWVYPEHICIMKLHLTSPNEVYRCVCVCVCVCVCARACACTRVSVLFDSITTETQAEPPASSPCHPSVPLETFLISFPSVIFSSQKHFNRSFINFDVELHLKYFTWNISHQSPQYVIFETRNFVYIYLYIFWFSWWMYKGRYCLNIFVFA